MTDMDFILSTGNPFLAAIGWLTAIALAVVACTMRFWDWR